MPETQASEIDELIREIEAYLALVDVLRGEGLHPAWLAESTAPRWWLDEWIVSTKA
jgi:hypothetical protein